MSLVCLIWINRNRLKNLHIDRPYLTIIIVTGGVLFLWYLPIHIGFFILIFMGFIGWAIKNDMLNYQDLKVAPLRLILYVLLTLIPLIPTLLYVLVSGTQITIDRNSTFNAFITSNLLGVVFEEILFRGLLWMLLLDLNINERKILYVQMILFWISHYDLIILDRLYSFWVSLPFVGLLYGMIVRRDKSITPTTICHFIYNFVVGIVNQSL